jgi:hypothetical protein
LTSCKLNKPSCWLVNIIIYESDRGGAAPAQGHIRAGAFRLRQGLAGGAEAVPNIIKALGVPPNSTYFDDLLIKRLQLRKSTLT